jgi:hypothetical protein
VAAGRRPDLRSRVDLTGQLSNLLEVVFAVV